MDLASYALASGTVFHGRYRVVRCIKLGGMGAVYEVVDEKTDRVRALKVMLPQVVENADFRARFALEARVTGGIESDHIVQVSDAGIDEKAGAPFLVMDLLRGEDLGALLTRRGGLPPDEVVTYLHQASLALDKTHSAGIVHRDLKPDNLFVVMRDDGSPCMKILDFGIAKVVARAQSVRATKALGTPLYMSPEQVRGEGSISPAADIYALGHIAYTLLVGEAYWEPEAQNLDALFPLMARILAGPEETPSQRARRRKGIELPPTFDEWFSRATASDPERRFDSAISAVGALAQAFGMARPALGSRSSLTYIAPRISVSDPTMPSLPDIPPALRRSPDTARGPESALAMSSFGETKAHLGHRTDEATSHEAGRTAPRAPGWLVIGLAAIALLVGAAFTVRYLSNASKDSPSLPTASPERVPPSAAVSLPPATASVPTIAVEPAPPPSVAFPSASASGGVPPLASSGLVPGPRPSGKGRPAASAAPSARPPAVKPGIYSQD